jgi:hypothetical protein
VFATYARRQPEASWKVSHVWDVDDPNSGIASTPTPPLTRLRRTDKWLVALMAAARSSEQQRAAVGKELAAAGSSQRLYGKNR